MTKKGFSLNTIAILSDPHVNLGGDIMGYPHDTFLKCLPHLHTDAVAVCGDITENGLQEEWRQFFTLYKQHCPGKELFFVPGNMDGVWPPEGRKAFFAEYERFLGGGSPVQALYSVKETATCMLIGICPERGGDLLLSDSQLEFVEEAVASAARKDIPVFVFSHFLMGETFVNPWDYAFLRKDGLRVKAILEKYENRSFFFSGHIHRGLTAGLGSSVLSIKNVTYISTPSISAPDTEHYQSENEAVGTGYIATLQGKQVHLQGYDFLHDKPLPAFDWMI